MVAKPLEPIAATLALALLGIACAPEDAPLPSLEGEAFFDRPWPSDLRRAAGGGPDLAGFPKRDRFELVERYAAYAESLEGFGNNSPIYVRFQGAVDTSSLPDAAGSAGVSSSLLLIDVDRASPYRGELVPVEWSWQPGETEFQPENLLAVRPVYGFPLRPTTTYALVVREPAARVGDAFAQVWDAVHPDHGHYEPLQETLFSLGIDIESVAVAAIFTTQDPVSELGEYASYIQQDLDLPSFQERLELIDSFAAYDLYEGWVFAPLFQEGERPYSTEGGGLFRNATGEPRPYCWEWIRYSLAVPTGYASPEEGFPLYIYSHGTGGDYITYANNGVGLEVANVMALQGYAGLGIDQPLHGLRATDDTDADFHSFNVLNPDSARGNFRQGALDQVFLASALAASNVFVLPSGPVRIDPTRMVFLGHSQGGISGALSGPFLGRELRAMFLSGAGGGLGQTIMYREAGMDIPALLSALLELDEDETLDTFHPVVALVQWLSDVTDPINYAPYWFHEEPGWDAEPIHVGMSEGVLDTYTPHQTTEALAAAGRVPLLQPVASASLAHELRGISDALGPVAGNAASYADGRVTAGLVQYGDQGHFAIFDDYEAAALYREFLTAATESELPTFGTSQQDD